MDRRSLLSGTGVALTSAFAGCLDENDTDDTVANPDKAGSDEDDAADAAADGDDDSDDREVVEEVPEDARETGAAVIEALVAGDDEVAVSYAPHEYIREPSAREELLALYADLWRPDAVHSIEFRAASDGSVFHEDAIEDDAVLGPEYELRYEIELEADDHRYEHHGTVSTIEVNGEWYAWFVDDFRLRPDASVDVDRNDPDVVEITLTERAELTTVFVRGGGIDDPEAYQLESVDESVTLTVADVGSGTYEVIATIDDDLESGSTLETFTVVDPDDWTDVSEITLEARVSGWVGIEPEHVEGTENPTLVLSAGEEYAISWEGGDGLQHNIELRNGNDEVVGEHRTELTDDPGPDQVVEFTATPELAYYVCAPHEATMRGEIVVEE